MIEHRFDKIAKCEAIHWSKTSCPHCLITLGFPNVRKAQKGASALEQRYNNEKKNSAADETKFQELQNYVNQQAKIVLAVGFEYLLHFLVSKNGLYVNYHRLVQFDIRLAAGEHEHKQRVDADNQVFCGYMDEISMCALSLSDTGAWGYGEYHLRLNLNMVHSRISFTQYNTYHYQWWFEQSVCPDTNKIIWLEKPGYRATWENMPLLAIAKHAAKITLQTSCEDFSAMFLFSDGDRDTEDYIEGHIYGPLTVATIGSIRAPSETEYTSVAGHKSSGNWHNEGKQIERRITALNKEGRDIDFKRGD